MSNQKSPVTFAKSPDFVVSLARGLDIIKAFGVSEPDFDRLSNMHPSDALTLSDVAKRTGLARAVVRRFLHTLVALGYVITDGKYFRLTAKILDLGYAYLSSFSLPKIAERFLEEVTLQTKESASASVLDEHEIVYVARVQTSRIMSVSLGIGSRLPAFCTSMGRVLLAYLPAEQLEKYLRSARFHTFTEKTICHPEALRRELNTVFKQGYALVDQELEIGIAFASRTNLCTRRPGRRCNQYRSPCCANHQKRTATAIPSGLAESCEEHLFLSWRPSAITNRRRRV